jgi:hypothetical protein
MLCVYLLYSSTPPCSPTFVPSAKVLQSVHALSASQITRYAHGLPFRPKSVSSGFA